VGVRVLRWLPPSTRPHSEVLAAQYGFQVLTCSSPTHTADCMDGKCTLTGKTVMLTDKNGHSKRSRPRSASAGSKHREAAEQLDSTRPRRRLTRSRHRSTPPRSEPDASSGWAVDAVHRTLTYDRHSYDAEKLEALARWTNAARESHFDRDSADASTMPMTNEIAVRVKSQLPGGIRPKGSRCADTLASGTNASPKTSALGFSSGSRRLDRCCSPGIAPYRCLQGSESQGSAGCEGRMARWLGESKVRSREVGAPMASSVPVIGGCGGFCQARRSRLSA
jgi:hypothetical protein